MPLPVWLGRARDYGGMGRARAAWLAIGALVLVALVAAGAGAPGPSSPAHAGGLGVPGWAGDLVVGLVMGGLVVMIYFLVLEDLWWRQRRKGLGWDRGVAKRPWWHSVVEVAAMAAFVALIVVVVADTPSNKSRPVTTPTGTSPNPHQQLQAAHGVNGLGWPPLLGGAIVAVLAIVGLKLWERAGKGGGLRPLGPLAAMGGERDEAVEAIDASLDALRAEPDTRRAVIAAYARMEKWLAYTGYGRHPWEAPFEHLDRVMADLGATAAVGAVLAGLYERAKFDRRPCEPEMKQAAIDALTELRQDLAGLPMAGGAFSPGRVGAA